MHPAFWRFLREFIFWHDLGWYTGRNQIMVKQLSKNTVQTATLLLGVLTALLLIFGTFFQTVQTVDLESLGLTLEPASLEQFKNVSSALIEAIQYLNL